MKWDSRLNRKHMIGQPGIDLRISYVGVQSISDLCVCVCLIVLSFFHPKMINQPLVPLWRSPILILDYSHVPVINLAGTRKLAGLVQPVSFSRSKCHVFFNNKRQSLICHLFQVEEEQSTSDHKAKNITLPQLYYCWNAIIWSVEVILHIL